MIYLLILLSNMCTLFFFVHPWRCCTGYEPVNCKVDRLFRFSLFNESITTKKCSLILIFKCLLSVTLHISFTVQRSEKERIRTEH